MNPDLSRPIQWRTAAFREVAETVSPDVEVDGLCQHLRQCSTAHSRARTLGHRLDALHRSMSGRFVTSLSLLVALLAATLLVW